VLRKFPGVTDVIGDMMLHDHTVVATDWQFHFTSRGVYPQKSGHGEGRGGGRRVAEKYWKAVEDIMGEHGRGILFLPKAYIRDGIAYGDITPYEAGQICGTILERAVPPVVDVNELVRRFVDGETEEEEREERRHTSTTTRRTTRRVGDTTIIHNYHTVVNNGPRC
jgi:hypothetical protein